MNKYYAGNMATPRRAIKQAAKEVAGKHVSNCGYVLALYGKPICTCGVILRRLARQK